MSNSKCICDPYKNTACMCGSELDKVPKGLKDRADRLVEENAELKKENEILEPLVSEKQNAITGLMKENAELRAQLTDAIGAMVASKSVVLEIDESTALKRWWVVVA